MALSRQHLADVAWGLRHFGPSLSAEFEAAMEVPFRVLPAGIPGLDLAAFTSEVDLRQEVVYLDDGARAVTESRLTSWQSDVGATFKYSGKVMVPDARASMSPSVANVRAQLERLTGVHFDSVLINYYSDGRCGMRFHSDPTYGCWEADTAVVSIGQTRRFVFREVGDHQKRFEYRVRSGDVVYMFGDCQERLQHCIKVERQDQAAHLGPRMSLVFKKRATDPATGHFLTD